MRIGIAACLRNRCLRVRISPLAPDFLEEVSFHRITTVRLKVEENQLVDVFGEIGTRIEGLKGA